MEKSKQKLFNQFMIFLKKVILSTPSLGLYYHFFICLLGTNKYVLAVNPNNYGKLIELLPVGVGRRCRSSRIGNPPFSVGVSIWVYFSRTLIMSRPETKSIEK